MTLLRFIRNSIKLRMSKIVILVLAVSLSTAILSGALFLGDSVKQTILTLGKEKIGDSRFVINSVNINKMLPQVNDNSTSENNFVPILKLPARSLINDSGITLNVFNAYAVGEKYFNNYQTSSEIAKVTKGEAFVNQYLAEQLNVEEGDFVQFRCGYFSNLSPSFSFYEGTQEFFTKRVKISQIIPNRGAGRFSTSVNQGIEPLILLNLNEFQEELSVGNKVNLYLAGGDIQIDKINEILNSSTRLSDLGLSVTDYTEQWKILSSDQLFITPEMLTRIRGLYPESHSVFSYFINSTQYSGETTPFLFVVGVEKEFLEKQYKLNLSDNQACVSSWLAEDIGIKNNAEIDINYFVTTSNQKLEIAAYKLLVKDVKSIEFFTSFKKLIPNFPGFSDKQSCYNWDPSIPIDLDNVRDKDEEYWNNWEFTPKIIVTFDKASKLWGTTQASATGILIPSSINLIILENDLIRNQPQSEKGYLIDDYIERVSKSGSNSINFSELFIGLSFLIIIAAVFLLIFIVQIFYSARKDEIFILKATGFTRHKIVRIYLIEVLCFTLPGIVIGIILGIAYNYFLMSGLTTFWYDAARLDSVLMSFTLKSIIISAFTSLIINLGVSFWVVRNIIKKIVTPSKPRNTKTRSKQLIFYILIASVLLILLILLTILYLSKIIVSEVAFFFMTGGLLLLLFPLIAVIVVKLLVAKQQNSFSVKQFILRSINFNVSRTVSIILITSLSVFMIISIGANKLIPSASNSEAGTGRYEVSVNTAQPVNPQQDNFAETWQIPDSEILPMRIKEGDEASCLNLNQIRNPRIASVKPEILGREKRFKLVEEVENEAGWSVLGKQLKPDEIPAIADAGVLKWSLGLKTGDSLEIISDNGQKYTLVFMAALSSSVFQGSVLISENNFMNLFPSSKGYNRFLIDLHEPDAQTTDQLKRVLRPYGAVVRSNISILEEYFSVQNTYISIFFQLGLLAMVFAVVGISVLLLKKIQEEKDEISIQRIIGFSKQKIYSRLFMENFLTILYGILAGSISSIIALLPIFKDNLSLLLEYPVSALVVISVCAIVFLGVFISMGLKSFNKMLPETR